MARGYKHGVIEDKLNREITVVVSGPEMGYVTTPICVITSANMILKHDNIPFGVLTPAVAFGTVMDEMIAQLSLGGVEFRIETRRDLDDFKK